jgi:antitoxin MazE
MVTHLSKWGNSLGLRLPKAFAEELGLHEGAAVDLKLEGGRIVIAQHSARPSLAELLDKVTADNRHSAVDDGAPVGREAW